MIRDLLLDQLDQYLHLGRLVLENLDFLGVQLVHDLQLDLEVLEDLSHLVFRTVQGLQEVQEGLADPVALSFLK